MIKSLVTNIVTICVVLSLCGYTSVQHGAADLGELDAISNYLSSKKKKSTKPKLVPIPEDIFEITDLQGNPLLCGTVNGKILGGKLKGEQYLTLTATVKATQQQLKRASGSQAQKLRAKLAKQKKTANANNQRCLAAFLGQPLPTAAPTQPPAGGGGDTPAPGNPTPTPTPTPVPTQIGNPLSCFQNGGNTKPGCFSIPSGLTGNVSQGASLWNNGGTSPFFSSCKGCHGADSSKYGRNFNQLKSSFNNPAYGMGINPSDSQIAHLTAYLNRFSP